MSCSFHVSLSLLPPTLNILPREKNSKHAGEFEDAAGEEQKTREHTHRLR